MKVADHGVAANLVLLADDLGGDDVLLKVRLARTVSGTLEGGPWTMTMKRTKIKQNSAGFLRGRRLGGWLLLVACLIASVLHCLSAKGRELLCFDAINSDTVV